MYDRGYDDGYHGRAIDSEFAADREYVTGHDDGSSDAEKAEL